MLAINSFKLAIGTKESFNFVSDIFKNIYYILFNLGINSKNLS